MPTIAKNSDLAEFQQLLIGTWQNVDELMQDGKPLSFNVMPLPQAARQPGRTSEPGEPDYGGFILKNFAFKETIRFNGTADKNDPPGQQDPEALAVVAEAPNRGGTYTQTAQALFYEQQVLFAEGPNQGMIVHVENGAWLYLGSEPQLIGPYNQGKPVHGQVLKQPPTMTVAKQISVPHGNSVLALGNVDLDDGGTFDTSDSGLTANTVFSGAPTIPDQFVPYPEPSNIVTEPYYDPYSVTLTNLEEDFENPDVAAARNPSYPLQLALAIIKPQAFIHWQVTTLPVFGGKGVVTNIPFEQRKARVTEYWADYWLLSTDPNAKETKNFDYLLYTQTILLKIQISTDGGKTEQEYVFPHVTSNTVKKVPSVPTQARATTHTQLQETPTVLA